MPIIVNEQHGQLLKWATEIAGIFWPGRVFGVTNRSEQRQQSNVLLRFLWCAR